MPRTAADDLWIVHLAVRMFSSSVGGLKKLPGARKNGGFSAEYGPFLSFEPLAKNGTTWNHHPILRHVFLF